MSNMSKQKKTYDIQSYRKSNTLIQSKYKTTPLGNKIMALGLYHLQKGDYYYTENGGNMVCEISVTEMKERLQRSGNSLYRDIENTSKRLLNYHLGYKNEGEQEFEYINLFTKMGYKNGVLTIVFNGDMKTYLRDLKDNYTILNLPLMMKWNNTYTFRLYELLSSRTYLYKKEGYVCEAEYKLSELKFILGFYDISDEKVAMFLKGKENPDFDAAEKILTQDETKSKKEKTEYINWTDFKRYTLEPAIKEINETEDADMLIEKVEPIRRGRGGKVHGVRFKYRVCLNDEKELSATSNDEESGKTQLSEDEKFEFEVDVKKNVLASYQLPISHIRAICDAAKYDMEKIKKAAQLLAQQKNVERVAGWLISCIKANYTTTSYKNKKNNNDKFNDFDQRDIDKEELAELESMLIKQGYATLTATDK